MAPTLKAPSMPTRPRARADDSSPPPSYFSSLRNKASQFSLRSFHRDSYTASSSVSSPASSRPATPSLLPTHHVGGSNADVRDATSSHQPPTEQTRLFGLPRWAQKPRSSNLLGKQPAYGAIRLEDTDDDDVRNIGGDDGSNVSDFGLSGTSVPMTRIQHVRRWFADRPLVRAGLQMAAIFILSTLFMGGTLKLALPKLEEADRPKLRIPKSFEQLQDLNSLLKKYKTIYPYRTLYCFVIVYLFLQAFSLPGSMYLSILGGAVWGMARALLLVCTCVATGATLCYAISAALGPALLTMPKWRLWMERWQRKVERQRANLLSFLIVIRIAPLPPHWVVNVAAPHLGIGIVPFWISTFFGIMGVSVIHTTIGGGLDEMTSAKDFKLISWKNFLGLSGIVVAVLIPVGIRYWFRGDIARIEEAERDAQDGEGDLDEMEGLVVESGGPVGGDGTKGKGKGRATDPANAATGLPPPTRSAHLDNDSDHDSLSEDSPSMTAPLPSAKRPQPPPFSRAGTLILLNDDGDAGVDLELDFRRGVAAAPDSAHSARSGFGHGLEAEFDELPPAMPLSGASAGSGKSKGGSSR